LDNDEADKYRTETNALETAVDVIEGNNAASAVAVMITISITFLFVSFSNSIEEFLSCE
jgi:hypothetical protein